MLLVFHLTLYVNLLGEASWPAYDTIMDKSWIKNSTNSVQYEFLGWSIHQKKVSNFWICYCIMWTTEYVK